MMLSVTGDSSCLRGSGYYGIPFYVGSAFIPSIAAARQKKEYVCQDRCSKGGNGTTLRIGTALVNGPKRKGRFYFGIGITHFPADEKERGGANPDIA